MNSQNWEIDEEKVLGKLLQRGPQESYSCMDIPFVVICTKEALVFCFTTAGKT